MNFEDGNWIGVVMGLITILLFYIIIHAFLKKSLIKRAKTKKMRHNTIVFVNLISYLFIIITVIMLISFFTGSTLGVGVTAGLLTAALGWALQRPITGIAAWIMVIMTRPFKIGDRIIIGSVRGDVINITLTHIYLNEFGGTIGGEDISGRIIFVPNSVLFEQNVINYTSQNDYILDEVSFTITYDSHIDRAKEIAKKVANNITKGILDKSTQKPFTRSNFQPSGIDLRVRYYTIASRRQEINSRITEGILKEINKEEKIRFAYPHTELFLSKRK